MVDKHIRKNFLVKVLNLCFGTSNLVHTSIIQGCLPTVFKVLHLFLFIFGKISIVTMIIIGSIFPFWLWKRKVFLFFFCWKRYLNLNTDKLCSKMGRNTNTSIFADTNPWIYQMSSALWHFTWRETNLFPWKWYIGGDYYYTSSTGTSSYQYWDTFRVNFLNIQLYKYK